MSVPFLNPPVRHWYCPNCGATDQTRQVRPHTRYHTCPRLHGLSAPMVPAGSKARVYAREREDYVGQERVFLDARGRPIMSIVTERADGSNDAMVFAPTATARADT